VYQEKTEVEGELGVTEGEADVHLLSNRKEVKAQIEDKIKY